MISNGYDGSLNRRRTPTALTVKDSVVIVNVLSYRNKRSHRFLAQMFEILDRWRVVVDLITTTEKSVSLAVASSVGEMKAVREAVGELEKLGKVSFVLSFWTHCKAANHYSIMKGFNSRRPIHNLSCRPQDEEHGWDCRYASNISLLRQEYQLIKQAKSSPPSQVLRSISTLSVKAPARLTFRKPYLHFLYLSSLILSFSLSSFFP